MLLPETSTFVYCWLESNIYASNFWEIAFSNCKWENVSMATEQKWNITKRVDLFLKFRNMSVGD